MEYTSHYNSPLGQITLASNGTCLTGLWFEGQKFFARTLSNCTQEKDLPVFHQTSEWLDCYFSGKKPDFTPALQLNDTPFRIAVWKILRNVAAGDTELIDRDGNRICHLGGKVAMNTKILNFPGEQVMLYYPDGTIRIFRDKNAVDSETAKKRYQLPFYLRNQYARNIENNICMLGGI